jgi:hypothetical protein
MMFRSLFAAAALAAEATSDTEFGFKTHFYAPEKEGTYPLILFVTGFSGMAPAFTYSNFVEQVAAKGYIVVGLDHLKAPNYPVQGADFHSIMEWANEGGLQTALDAQGVKATVDISRTAVMGQSAGNHVVGEGLKNGCSVAKALVMIDPVDGFDPFGVIQAQNLITPGEKLPFTIPSLLLDNELDPKSNNFLFPACAPAKLGAPRWFDATAGPVWNVNASKYGHVDCLNDLIIPAGGLVCPTDGSTDKKAYRKHLADTVALFLEGVLDDKPANFDDLEKESTFGVEVTLRKDLKGLPHSAVKAGCTNSAIVV